MQFDYFYPEESENYVFYRTPKVLCTDKRFRGLSSDAKLLYGILLDRIQLSKKNRWIDEEGHVYVYITIESLSQGTFQCTVFKGHFKESAFSVYEPSVEGKIHRLRSSIWIYERPRGWYTPYH